MARKLVVCCDGTWNTPRQNTNIFQTYRFLQDRLRQPAEKTLKEGVQVCTGSAADGSEVFLFYDQGVGANWYERLAGGAVGTGLSDNVRDAYRFLGEHFVPGSEIYVFGFSRGAYTARSLCGFVKAAGLLRQPSEFDVWRAYFDVYVTEQNIIARPRGMGLGEARRWLGAKAGDLIGRVGGPDVRTLPRHDAVKIRFVGVYDTVGALGVPLPAAATVNEPIVGFHDTAIGDLVEHAVHALAVDEKRPPYTPTLWTLAAGQALLASQSVLQVWFPGVHSDIGGGYKDKGIGGITLDFMMRQAAKRGLVLDPAHRSPALELSPLPAQHESFSAKWRALTASWKLGPSVPRGIGPTVRVAGRPDLTVAGDVRLHPSLIGRLDRRVTTILDEDTDQRVEEPYRPGNVSATTLPAFE